jgi:hypothetical protein
VQPVQRLCCSQCVCHHSEFATCFNFDQHCAALDSSVVDRWQGSCSRVQTVFSLRLCRWQVVVSSNSSGFAVQYVTKRGCAMIGA